MKNTAEHSDLVQKILAGTRWAMVLRATAQIFSWISTIIVVRFISPGDYGLNTMLESPLELLLLLSTFGLELALVQSKQIEREELRSIFGWLLLINGTLFLTYFFSSTLIAAYFNEPRIEPMAKSLAFIFLLVPFRVIPNALLDRELKFKLKGTVELIASIVAATTTLVLATMDMGVWALIAGLLTNRVLLSVLLMIYEPWIITPTLNFFAAQRMMVFGGIMALATALEIIGVKLSNLIIGPTFGAEMLGIYAIAWQFAILPLAKVMPIINPILFPAFSKLQDQPQLAAYYFEKSLGIATLVLFPIIIGMACVSEEFVQVILGKKWTVAAPSLAIFSALMVFRTITVFARPVLGSMGRADLSLKSTAILPGTLLPMTFFCLDYGIVGLTVAWAVTEPILMFATIHMLKQVMDTSGSRIAKSLLPAACSSMVLVIWVIWIKEAIPYANANIGNGLALVLEVLMGAIGYFMALRLFFWDYFKSAFGVIFGQPARG